MIETGLHIESVEHKPLINPNLIFVCGASAVGKTTLARYSVDILNERGIGAKMPVGYTTRAKRSNEINGIDYNFISHDNFRSNCLPLIRNNPEDWDVDQIGENFYFNRYSNTIPDVDYPISILPISLDTCDDMINKYSHKYSHISIGVIAVLLASSNIDVWQSRVAALRPHRDASKELLQNNSFLPPESVTYMSLIPTWDLESDVSQFMNNLTLSIE